MTESRHLLVTNDFPPKIGGIQNYLWELWRRLPPDTFSVYTTPYPGATTFDARQAFSVERSPEPVIGPYPWLIKRLDAIAEAEGAGLILLDPAIPLGIIGPRLGRPYGVVLHGAEVTIPGRLPISRQLLANTLRSASLVIAAGHYALAEAERCAGKTLPAVVVPPGVDLDRFAPAEDKQRMAARRHLGLDDDDFVVATVNRLVPRKGMHQLVEAAGLLRQANTSADHRGVDGDPDFDLGGRQLQVLIGGTGRQERQLASLIEERRAPVRLMGRISDEEVVDLYHAADAMAMLCHDRWFGLEQEGFGIVFLEAAAAGIPQVAGRSGGAHEAVVDGETGVVVADPEDPRAVAAVLASLSRDPDRCRELGRAARLRAEEQFGYERLAKRLADGLASLND